jgi:hypothetical protein
MAYYLIEIDGIKEFHEIEDGQALPVGATSVPRLPEDSEQWDGTKYVRNDELYADRTVSETHLKDVHLLKAMEAVLVLSGYELTCGLLKQEADTTGLPIADIAATVYSYYQTTLDVERDRRVLKESYRQLNSSQPLSSDE